MIEIKLSPGQYEELFKKGYDLNIIFLLKMIEGEYDNILTQPKILALSKTIFRKGLINSEGCLTETGRELLSFLSSTEKTPKLIKKKKDKSQEVDNFTLWWKNYPATDTFEYKGKKFNGTRALRVKKDECKIKINKILESGEYTINELVEALKLEIQQKAENSYKTGQNKMSFFQNSLTYINQQTFDPFVELVRAGHKAEEKSTKSVYGGVSI